MGDRSEYLWTMGTGMVDGSGVLVVVGPDATDGGEGSVVLMIEQSKWVDGTSEKMIDLIFVIIFW